MVEQGTHKPLDVGSNPTLATIRGADTTVAPLLVNKGVDYKNSNNL